MKKSLLLGLMLLILPLAALAITAQSTTDLLQTSMTTSLDAVFSDLQNYVFKWLGLFILVQMIWVNWGLIVSGGDLEKVLAKFVAGLSWAGICIFVMNNGPDFIKSIANYLLDKAAGLSHNQFSPAYPVDLGLDAAVKMLTALDGTKTGVLSMLNPLPSIMLGLVSVVILASCAIIAFKVLMIMLETKIVIALSPLSFAMLGLSALRDQGFAPLKYLISLAYRVMIYGAILAAMTTLSDGIVAAFKTLPPSSDPNVWPPLWTAAIGFGLLGALGLRADSIAAMLSSGTSQMSTGDAAAVSAVAGAAAGAGLGAVAGALSGAATGAASGGQSMGDFMKSMTGGGAIKNESATGFGGKDPIGNAPVRPPSPSLSSPPVRPGSDSSSRSFPSTGESGPVGSDPARPPSAGSDSGAQSSSSPSAVAPTASAAPTSSDNSASSSTSSTPPSDTPAKPSSDGQTGGANSDASPSDAGSQTKDQLGNPGPERAQQGDGSSAGIGGSEQTDMHKKLDQLLAGSGPRKKSVGDHLGDLNRLAEQDVAPVHVSLNTSIVTY